MCLKFSICLTFANFFNVFSSRRLRHSSSHTTKGLDEKSWIALRVGREHSLKAAVPHSTFPSLVQLQHGFHHELPAHTLELLFRSVIVGSSKRSCLLFSPLNMLLCQQIPSLVSVCFLCVFSIEGLVKSAVGDVVDMFWNAILHDARTGITAS